jgi:hypothetical protein
MIAQILILTASLLIVQHGHASDTIPKAVGSNKQGYKDLQLPDFKGLDETAPQGKSGVKGWTSCKTPEGREIKEGEAGFESCLSSARNNCSKNSTPGQACGPNMNFTIGH